MNDNLDEKDLIDVLPEAKDADGLWETVKTILFAVIIAVGVRTFAYEPFSIPSGSMIPTLLVGDYLFVSKFSYGYSKHSFPLSVPIISGRILFSDVTRGDVAVFKLPTNPRIDYIKRIIGLPGDTIQVKGGVLHINGEAVIRESLGEYVYRDTSGLYRTLMRYNETLPGGKVHEILEESDHDRADNTPVYTVPAGHYFAMGDNRDHSQDSRYQMEVGFIPKENLVGRATFLFFSIDGSFWKIWNWGTSMRFNRFFNGIN